METSMETTPAILVINATPHAHMQAELQEYLGQIIPIFTSHGGKMISRARTIEQVIGENGPALTANFEFPSADAIRAMLASAEFNALNELRSAVYQRLDLMISEPL